MELVEVVAIVTDDENRECEAQMSDGKVMKYGYNPVYDYGESINCLCRFETDWPCDGCVSEIALIEWAIQYCVYEMGLKVSWGDE